MPPPACAGAALAGSTRRVKSPSRSRMPGSSGTALPAPTGLAALSMNSPPEDASVTITRPSSSDNTQCRRETNISGSSSCQSASSLRPMLSRPPSKTVSVTACGRGAVSITSRSLMMPLPSPRRCAR